MLLFVLLISLLNAELVEYTLNIEYKWMTIDNFKKAVICVNGLNVGPIIRCNKGDTLRINVINNLFLKGLTVHWHGLKMTSTPWLDGTPISQCSIQVGDNMTYEFIAYDIGTHWYHSHTELERDDAFYGPIIIDDINETTKINYDEEYIIMFSDFHKEYSEEIMQMIKSSNFHWPGQPYRLLVNGMTNFNISVSYNKTYLIRFISATSHSYLNVSFSGHNASIVEVEGSYTNPLTVEHLWINSGERYTVLLKADNPGCYWVNISSMSDPINVLMGLTYDNISCESKNYVSVINNNLFDTSLLTSKYPVVLPKPNKNLSIYMNVYTVTPNYRIFTYNNISTELPNTPILLSYYLGTYISNNKTFILNVDNGDVIDIELINHAKFQHVSHFHSVSFYVLNSDNPIKRDTITTESGQSTLIRVFFDNPGCFLIHCHSSKHHEMGLIMAFCYDPKTIPRPPSTFKICGKTFGEINSQKYLMDTIYSLGAIIGLILISALIISVVMYKKKKLDEERMRLIV